MVTEHPQLTLYIYIDLSHITPYLRNLHLCNCVYEDLHNVDVVQLLFHYEQTFYFSDIWHETIILTVLYVCLYVDYISYEGIK